MNEFQIKPIDKNKSIDYGPEIIEHSEGKGTVLESLKPDVNEIKAHQKSQLLESGRNSVEKEDQIEKKDAEIHKSELTKAEKAKIKERTGWSDEIIDNIKNWDQYKVLKKANLKETKINGRTCLIKEDIDMDNKDAFGKTNLERMEMGLAPIDKATGKPIELHHLGQKADSPFAELTVEEHRTGEYIDGLKNQSLWHDNSITSEVHGGQKEIEFREQRENHWKTRANE